LLQINEGLPEKINWLKTMIKLQDGMIIVAGFP